MLVGPCLDQLIQKERHRDRQINRETERQRERERERDREREREREGVYACVREKQSQREKVISESEFYQVLSR